MNNFLSSSIPFVIAGPCAVENLSMMEEIVSCLVKQGIFYIRAGAFKPRTSPKDFQGLGDEGLLIFQQIRRKYPIKIVSEIISVNHLEKMIESVDVLQVGSRNMYNYDLLKELGKTQAMVILKRGLSATIREFLCAAEYLKRGGNQNVILCERGIRTYETETRNTLDISCIPILKKESDYPVVVDISHSLGRTDIAQPMARAALAAGADGLMVEVHRNPITALSDQKQQMDFGEFFNFYTSLCKWYSLIFNDISKNR